ncbi:MAG: M48 family metallopeptidase [bacterium]|nr:M48 family metallopeptidase [bacterium]
MNIYLFFILCFYSGSFILDLVADLLNVSSTSETLPEEFEGIYDSDKYKKSQQYLKENTAFNIASSSFMMLLTIPFILLGGFNYIDRYVSSFNFGSIVTGLLFFGLLSLISLIAGLPFSIYKTFVIEEKYGFNKTTVKTFIMDFLKAVVLGAILGALVLSALLWFFARFEGMAWIYCWLFIVVFQLFILFIAPVWIMPLFNKFEPLKNKELKEAIEKYVNEQNFKVKGLFQMDGSRRSSKSNAFFTGFGKYRRIVLFDTLIEKHTVKELVAVVAHEVGHYKKKHIFKMLLISLSTTALMLYLMSKFINNPGLFEAFKMDKLSIYASLLFFSFLYTPLARMFSMAGNIFSRKHEFEADKYAVDTTADNKDMIDALKKLSVDNLSNLTPHPFKVFLEYSHPPVLRRIKRIS